MTDKVRAKLPDGSIAVFPAGTTGQQIEKWYSENKPADPIDWTTRARLAGQGATFGWGDEMTGAVRSLLDSDLDYTTARDQERAAIEKARTEHPWQSAAWEIGGGLLTGGLGAAKSGVISGGRTIGRQIWNGAKVGGALGAIGGAGEAKEGFVDTLGSAVGGGLLGATIGGAVPGVVGASKSIAGASRAAKSPESWAARKLAQSVDDSGYTVPQIRQKMAQDPQNRLADIGPTLQGRAAAVAAVPGAGQHQIHSELTQRAAEIPERVNSAVRSTLGSGRARSTIEALTKQQEELASPAYNAIRDRGDTWGMDALGPLAENRLFKTTVNKIRNELAEDTRNVLPPEGTLNFDILDRTRNEIYRKMSRYYQKQNFRRGRDVSGLYRELTGISDDLVPGYSEARALFSGPAQIKDGVETGRRIIKTGSIEDVLDELDKIKSPSELQAVRLGATSAIDEALADQTGAAAIRQVTRRMSKLRAIFGDDAAKELQQHMETLSRQQQSKNVIIGNSATAARQAGRADLEEGPAAGLASISSGSGIVNWLKSKAVSLFDQDVRRKRVAEIGPLLMSTDPAEVERALKMVVELKPELAGKVAEQFAAGAANIGPRRALEDRQ